MGKSLTIYNGFGFWARDAQVQLWLRLMVLQIEKSNDPSLWLLDAKEKWNFQTYGAGHGSVTTSLDEIASTDHKLKTIIELSEEALSEWISLGDLVSLEYLRTLNLENESFGQFTGDWSSSTIQEYATSWLSLLSGDFVPSSTTKHLEVFELKSIFSPD